MRQEIFNRVRDHLLKQNARSVDDFGECLYRSPSGLKCAVGCLIADAAYHQGLENATPEMTSVQKALKDSGVELDEITVGMLMRLQFIHDAESPSEWRESLNNLGVSFGLNTRSI